MRRSLISLLMTGFALASIGAVQAAEKADTKTENGCKVIEEKADKDDSGTLSSSVTAGGGRVSGSTTGAGNSVTVHSGDGSTSSSVATAGSSGGSTVVAGTGSGDCTIIRRKK